MKKPYLYIIIFTLITITVLSSLFAVFAFATDGIIDLSKPTSSHNKELDSATVLEMILSEKLIDEEREYLKEYGELKIKFDTGVPSSLVSTEYKNKNLTVSAYEYTYNNKNGDNVTWVPTSITLKRETKPTEIEVNRYFATFLNVEEDDKIYAEVNYICKVKVTKESINSIVNKAYNDAPKLEKEIERKNAEYEALKKQYDLDLISYNNYLEALSQYQSELLIYKEYLSVKKIYEDKLAEYEKYLEEKKAYEQALIDSETYESRLQEFNRKYAIYREYLKDLEEYDGKCLVYNEYLKELTAIRNQLSVIDASKWSATSLNRDIYSAIMGDLVTQVVENKSLIVGRFGVDAKVVDSAGLSTERLRELLTNYFAITDEREKYAYYTLNYENLRDNFTLLLKSLDNLYKNEKVEKALRSKEKDVKYIILLSQLYYVARALNTTPIKSYFGDYYFDENYKITSDGVSQTPRKILENQDFLIQKENPTPKKTGYPPFMPKPEVPPVVEKPIKPEQVVIPAEPTPKLHPGEPPKVVENPTLPQEVENPGEPPKLYTPPTEQVNLIKAYKSSKLCERELFTQDKILELKNTVNKKVFNVSSASVIYHNHLGQILYSTEVDIGSFANYEGELPTKKEDDRATYEFEYWVNKDGERVDLSHVKGDLRLYPHYTENIKYYDITFTVEGVSQTHSLPYGAIPEYSGKPIKSDDGDYLFNFKGWDKEIAPVISHASYVAQFEKAPIVKLEGERGAKISYGKDAIFADCRGTFLNEFDITQLVKRAVENGQYGIYLKTPVFDLEISYSTACEIYQQENTFILETNRIQSGTKGLKFSVNAKDSTGNSVEKEYSFNLITECKLNINSNLQLTYSGEDESTVFTPFNINEGILRFSLTTSRIYTLAEFYRLNKIPSSLVDFDISQNLALSNTEIKINLTVPKGVKVDKIYLIDNDGNEHVISNGKFKMPKGDISIGVVASKIKYKITFINGDNVIATYFCNYGDTVTPPKDPIKVSDLRYKYTFKGWSSKIETVTSDAVYRAEFSTELLPKREEPEGLQINPQILRLIVIGLVTATGIGLTTVSSLGYCIYRIVLKKRKKI